MYGIAAAEEAEVDRRQVDIYSEGTRMTGYAYTPTTSGQDQKLPTIVMAHGWVGTQQGVRRNVADFSRNGYPALAWFAKNLAPVAK